MRASGPRRCRRSGDDGQRAAPAALMLALLAGPALAQQPPDPLARADAFLRPVVHRHIANETKGDRGGTEVVAAEQADLDGDGKPEWVVLWTRLGAPPGRRRRTGRCSGCASRAPRAVDTLMPGPNDARCCPTRKTVQRVRWQGGKLVSNQP